MTVATRSVVTRAQVEDFLYHEAALLDDWRLDDWEKLLADDAAYYVPPNDQLESDHLILWAVPTPCRKLVQTTRLR